MVRVPRNTLK